MSRAERATDAAAAWLIRREDGEWSDSDQAAFDAWLAESDGNKAAYWRLEHSWRGADRIGSLALPSTHGKRAVWRRHWKPLAIAASLALTIGGSLAAYMLTASPAPKRVAMEYDTPVGGQRTVALGDGSTVELNTRTKIRTAVSKDSRDVWLLVGEAFFDIRHDPNHPFVVHAGPKTIRVLGTQFSVRRDDGNVTVAVLTGRVRIDESMSVAGRPEKREDLSSATITSGSIAISRGSSTLVTRASTDRVENRLAWRNGMLVFDGTPLSAIAAEFNRYNTRQIVVTDSATANISIGGSFQASNVAAFLRLLHEAYGLKIEENGDQVRISS